MDDFVPAQAQHLSLGVQRQVTSDFAVTADFAFRHYIHEKLRGVDLNHYNAVGGPVIPACAPSQATVPGVPAPTVPSPPPSAAATALTKRCWCAPTSVSARRYQVGVAYALQSDQNIYGLNQLYTPITNLKNWTQNVGPSSPRHVLNISGMVEVPGGVQVSFISSFNSRQPFQPIITGTDFYGTGVDQFLLPGSGTNQFNFSLGKSDMVNLVNQYNQTYGGKKAPNPAQVFPTVTLPQEFETGDSFISQDLRVTKVFRFKERLEWQVFGEVFNVLNIANLSGYADNLLAPGLRPAHQPLQQCLRHRRPAIFPVGHAIVVLAAEAQRGYRVRCARKPGRRRSPAPGEIRGPSCRGYSGRSPARAARIAESTPRTGSCRSR